MILILSWDEDEHVPYVARRLEERGAEYVWFAPPSFPHGAEATLSFDDRGLARRLLRDRGREIDLDQVKAVWLRRLGTPGVALEVREETQREWAIEDSRHCLTGVWDTLDCLWVPARPRVDRAGYNKVHQLALAARVGFPIPRTRVTNSPEAFLEFYEECGGRIVTKVLWDGHVQREGDRCPYMSFTRPVRRRDAASYQSLRYAPMIVQEYVPKQVELRITVVDEQVFAAEIRSQASRVTQHDWRHYDNERATYVPHALPTPVEQLCVRMVQALGLCFGTVDLVLTPEGEYLFLEVNPNGQWAWVEDLTGLPIADAIAGLLIRGPVARA